MLCRSRTELFLLLLWLAALAMGALFLAVFVWGPVLVAGVLWVIDTLGRGVVLGMSVVGLVVLFFDLAFRADAFDRQQPPDAALRRETAPSSGTNVTQAGLDRLLGPKMKEDVT